MPLAPEIGSVWQVLARIGGVDPTTSDNCSLALDTASIDVYIRIDGTRVLVGSHVSLKAQTGLFLEYDILVEILMPGVFCHANRLLVDHLQTNPKVRGRLNIFKPPLKGIEARDGTTCISWCSISIWQMEVENLGLGCGHRSWQPVRMERVRRRRDQTGTARRDAGIFCVR